MSFAVFALFHKGSNLVVAGVARIALGNTTPDSSRRDPEPVHVLDFPAAPT